MILLDIGIETQLRNYNLIYLKSFVVRCQTLQTLGLDQLKLPVLSNYVLCFVFLDMHLIDHIA